MVFSHLLYLNTFQQLVNFRILSIGIYFTMSDQKKFNKIITQVDDFGRKKFTLQENGSQDQPDDKEQKFIDTGRYTSTLLSREEKVDIEKYLGKIEGNKKKKITEVFYCQVCQLGFKCDMAYLTHINSPAHNRKLGMNMKVTAVSVQTVSQKLARMQKEKLKSKKQKILEKKLGKNWENQILKREKPLQFQQKEAQQSVNSRVDVNQSLKNQDQLREEDERNKKSKSLKQLQVQNEQNQEGEQDEQDEDQKMMKSLGLPTSFGSKHKKY